MFKPAQKAEKTTKTETKNNNSNSTIVGKN